MTARARHGKDGDHHTQTDESAAHLACRDDVLFIDERVERCGFFGHLVRHHFQFVLTVVQLLLQLG